MKPLSMTMMLSDSVGFVGGTHARAACARRLRVDHRRERDADRREDEHEHVHDDVEEGDDVELPALFVGRQLLARRQATDRLRCAR
jgi:hypothetical protein